MPANALEGRQARGYTRAWDALASMLDAGKSWSGRERNCAFLNSGDGRFADVSALVEFNLPADSRGLALTDWDHDGDLDVWLTNRTAPALQFLRNELADPGRSLVLRLSARRGNRDAIGARVEVVTDPPGPRLVKSLRAGEGYLSQSSKWLHFGLPAGAAVEKVLVRWPGGAPEEFSGFGEGHRYRLAEGTGEAQPLPAATRALAIRPGAAELPPPTSTARVIAHSRLPLPRLSYLDAKGGRAAVAPGRQPLVINLWATWCQPCLGELADWKSERDTFAGMTVLCLSTDEIDGVPQARLEAIAPTLAKLDLPFETGLATPRLLEHLDVVSRVLIAPQGPLSLPCTFLLDPDGQLIALYKGMVAPGTLRRDARVIGETSRQNHRDHAVPFPGRWYINPLPPDLLAIPEKLLALSDATEARSYLDRHVSMRSLASDPDLQVAMPPGRVADLYFRISLGLGQQSQFTDAQSALETAWEIDPGRPEIALKLAALYGSQQQHDLGIGVLRKAVSVRRNEPVLLNNLAWMLATHPVPGRRDAVTAQSIAEQLCRQTSYQAAVPIDTLAAAHAAAGRFPRAASLAERALTVLGAGDDPALRVRMQRRLESYRAGQMIAPGPQ